MNTFVFIAFILIGASLLSAGLVIIATMMSSRASKRLAEKYPTMHGEQSRAATANGDVVRSKAKCGPNVTQMIAH